MKKKSQTDILIDEYKIEFYKWLRDFGLAEYKNGKWLCYIDNESDCLKLLGIFGKLKNNI